MNNIEIIVEPKIITKNLICHNCCKLGHEYKNCKFPIVSWGIILINDCNSELKFLMIRRKHSLGYNELIRGKYNLNNIDYVSFLFKQMTTIELKKIQSFDFNKLWIDLWGCDEDSNNSDQNIVKYKYDYKMSKRKFNILKSLEIWNSLCDTKLMYKYAEWGFPKGRKTNSNENDVVCALREFTEETGITSDKINIIFTKPLVEYLIGTNGKKYKHIYYVAKLKYELEFDIIHRSFNINNNEIDNIGLFNGETCKKLIRPYHYNKIELIKKIMLNHTNNQL